MTALPGCDPAGAELSWHPDPPRDDGAAAPAPRTTPEGLRRGVVHQERVDDVLRCGGRVSDAVGPRGRRVEHLLPLAAAVLTVEASDRSAARLPTRAAQERSPRRPGACPSRTAA